VVDELSDELLDLDSLEADLPALAEQYAAATPYPHLVLDDFLRPDAFVRAHKEFDEIDPELWTNYLHVNERKHSNTEVEAWGPTLQAVAGALTSPRFVSFLSELSGFPGLLPDPTMDGGGLHRSTAGGYLNVHADFTAHHVQPLWRRRVNILLYLNSAWDTEWGGELELWSTDMARCEQRVAPLGNRLLVFTTADDSFHGHPEPLRCPPEVARQSMALYYFTQEAEPHVKATNYRPRPGDGIKGAAIYLDKQLLRAYDGVKRRFHLSDDTASRLMGAVNRVRRRR
jgi:hypothetical protein